PFGYWARGRADFHAADYKAAVRDVAQAAELKPDQAYFVLWLYLARVWAHEQDADADLESRAAKLKATEWPYPVVELYLGRRSPEETLMASSKPDERCEAEFYIGEWQLLLDDRTAAIESLRAAANTCPRSFIEFTSARAELRLL